MKKAGIVIAAILCIGVICGGFYYVSRHNSPSTDQTKLTEVQKVITKNLETDYPETPREVVKFYNRILKCYYSEDYKDDELDELCDQALALFDEDLKENNPKDTYKAMVQGDVEQYKQDSKTIAQYNVCDSDDVLYKTDNGDSLAYVSASYFIKESGSYNKTYQTYVLRKDADGKWKILVYYQTKGPNGTEEENG